MSIDDGINKLTSLFQRRGYITYVDINETFPDLSFSTEELDEIYVKLRNFDVEILEHAPNPDGDSRA
jgi:hypothetical protein